jgi:hypothetical protein
MEVIDENGAVRFMPEERMGCQTREVSLNAVDGSAATTTSVTVSTAKPTTQPSAEAIGIGGAPTRPVKPPKTAEERKQRPVFSGVLQYFPDAILAVAQCSWQGNEQHNPGQPLHWARGKSTDEGDCIVRHQMEAGTIDSDGIRHSAKVAWRALAQLQKEIEAETK